MAKRKKYGELEMENIENTPFVVEIDWDNNSNLTVPQVENIKVRRLSSPRNDKFLAVYEGDVRLVPLEFYGTTRFF